MKHITPEKSLFTFYVIATPIGNMSDMTFRAIEILKNVDLILCEDTRTSRKLLEHYQISTKTESYHANSSTAKSNKIIEMVREGKTLALISDAGTPCISDPGVLIVRQLKDEFGKDISIVPIPGASAVISAIQASGVPSSEFTFLGFMPHKKGRETLFKEILDSKRTMVFYESPHRIEKTLQSLEKFVPEAKIVIAREITKLFEEFLEGTPSELITHFKNNPNTMKGEFVVLIPRK